MLIICGELNEAKTTALSRHLNVKQISKAATSDKNLLDPILINAPDKSNQEKQQNVTIRTGKIDDMIKCIEEIDWTNIIKQDAAPQKKFNDFYVDINTLQKNANQRIK